MTILTAPGSVHSDIAAYNLYFGMGQRITLIDDPRVFRVSPAGEAFGALIARRFGGRDRDARFLDLGTGSGVHALLLRQLGMRNITASDISLEAVQAARANELVNLGESCIEFVHGDLFDAVPSADGGFDVILFNPPGWQTPSDTFLAALQSVEAARGLSLEAMFYGEQTLRRFFERVPAYLKPGGKLLIGLNSLVDIAGVMRDLYGTHGERFKIDWSLLERHEIPLVLYTEQWRALQGMLHDEIERWTDQGRAHCRFDDSGMLLWSYEIIEFSFTPIGE